MRLRLAFVLICLLAGDAAADPFALVLANSESAPEVTDPAATNAHEAVGEPTTEGELDAADLSKLGSRLSSIALTYEAFRDVSTLDADAKALVDYTSPRGLIPNPADRNQTLDRVYRALALIDDTQALRYPEGEACARAHRRTMLRSSDGLFADPKTGELTPWLKAELNRSQAGDAPSGLIAASAREWTALGYLKSLAEVRALSLQLSDKNILGSPRAAAFCRRAKVYEELAAAQTALKWNDPDLAAQTRAVVEVRWGKEKGTGTVIFIGDKPVALVSSRFTENAYEAPDLFTKSGARLPASYLRHGPALSILSVQPGPDVEPLTLPENPAQEERVAYAVGHPIQGGPWSVTRGLARPAGALLHTDSAIDGTQAGGPLFDALGRLTGIVAGQGISYDLAAIKTWLKDEDAKLPEAIDAPDLGTGALLTASSPVIPEERSGLIEAGIVCKDARGCAWPPPSAAAPPSMGIDHSAPYNGPNLWSILGKIFSPAPKRAQPMRQVQIQDNRPARSAPSVVQKPPEPPKEPLRPSRLELALDRTTAARGEAIWATITMSFTGEEGARAGRAVTFEADPKDLAGFELRTTMTDGSGRARARVLLTPSSEQEARFDELAGYEARLRGKSVAETVAPAVKPGDTIGAVKASERKHDDELDKEAQKHLDAGESPMDGGLSGDRPLIIEGRILTVSATAGRLQAKAQATVTDKRCPPGTAARPIDPENASPGEPARGDTSDKQREAACREIEREAGRACGDDEDCVAAERVRRGYKSLGCGEPRSRTPIYDLGSPPNAVPKSRRPDPRYECVPEESAVDSRVTTYRSEASPENTGPARRAAPTQEELIARIWAILKPDGQHWIGERNGGAVLMKGTIDDAIKLFERLAERLQVGPHPNSDIKGGRRTRLGDVTIGLRPASQSGPPTIDVNVPGQNPIKVKFINDP